MRAVAPEPHMPAVRDRVGDRPSRKPGERRASLRVTGEHGAELAVGSGRGHERTITHHRLVHTLDLRLTLHADRTLEARFPAGNPVDRTIEHAPFTAPAPADPNLITGNWTGERLNHNWLHLAVQSRQQPTPKNQQNAAA